MGHLGGNVPPYQDVSTRQAGDAPAPFSLSLNPPPKVRVPIEVFESAIETIEQRLGLVGQPRAVVFHEKDGRRHAHAVWSRIDTEHMKAVNLSHYKLKLRDIARFMEMRSGSPTKLREHFRQATGQRKDFSRGRDPARDRNSGPEFER